MSKFHIDISFVVDAKSVDEARAAGEKALSKDAARLMKSARYQHVASSIPANVPTFDSNMQLVEGVLSYGGQMARRHGS